MESNKCINWKLKVLDQKKNEHSITMNCQMAGKDKDSQPLLVRVMILPDGEYDTKCEWAHKDLTGTTVLVDGNFKNDEWVKGNGNAVTTCTIFADKIEDFVYDKENPVEINKCVGWNLKVFETKYTSKGSPYLICRKNAGKREDGTWKKSMNIKVFASKDMPKKEQEVMGQLDGKNADVNGTFVISEYKTSDGEVVQTFGIFANSIKEHQWENKDGK